MALLHTHTQTALFPHSCLYHTLTHTVNSSVPSPRHCPQFNQYILQPTTSLPAVHTTAVYCSVECRFLLPPAVMGDYYRATILANAGLAPHIISSFTIYYVVSWCVVKHYPILYDQYAVAMTHGHVLKYDIVQIKGLPL